MANESVSESTDQLRTRGANAAAPFTRGLAWMRADAEAGENHSSVPLKVPRWKRLLDLTLIMLALPVLVPLMVVIPLLIALVSRGPVLFRQERVGHGGRRFVCLKFRTMRVGNQVKGHQDHLLHLMTSNRPMVKMDALGDSRIIPFGRLLRASGLDELPQLINVIRGEMSLVGPRPCLPYEYDHYLPRHKERFNSLPGLTGLWQVSGKNKTTFEEMIRLDINYSRAQTPGRDMAILLKTILVIAGQLLESRSHRAALAGAKGGLAANRT